jgi:hypothetical protein
MALVTSCSRMQCGQGSGCTSTIDSLSSATDPFQSAAAEVADLSSSDATSWYSSPGITMLGKLAP